MRRWVAAGSAVVTTLATAGAMVAPASGAAAKGGKSTGWKAISTPSDLTAGTDAPSVAQFGSTYEAAWMHTYGTGTSHTYGIDARILSGGDKPVGKVITVTKGWSVIAADPVILKADGMRVIAFNGAKGSNPASPYGTPAEYYFTSSNGKAWTLHAGGLTAETSFANDASVAAIGSTSIITAEYGGDRIQYNVGFPTSANPPSSFDGHTEPTGNYADLPGVAATGSKAWIAWYSSSNIKKNGGGIQVQQVLPSTGTRMQAPGTYQKANNLTGATHERVPIVIAHGKPFVAYSRYDNQGVYVWKVGAKKPFAKLKTPGEYEVTLATGPGGRIWVLWYGSGGTYASRSNKADTHFGPKTHVSNSPNQAPGAMLASGSHGPLVVTAFIGNYAQAKKDAIFSTEIRPRLSCSASPSTTKGGKKVAIKVVDAGDPVKGAKVSFAKVSKKTNKKGLAKIHVPHAAGTYAAKASISGYVGCTTKVHVT
ncbi:MAG TPA: hypothetical protein VMH41_02070 [Mycobacteriales bacterium]|nr:hypothetical protein [Mycobacteriales bacterium]